MLRHRGALVPLLPALACLATFPACARSPVRAALAVEAPAPVRPASAASDVVLDLEPLLREDPELEGWLAEGASRKLEVLVAIPEDGGVRRSAFRADAEYFYPASAVKLCLAYAALEKLADLRAAFGAGLTPATPLRFVTGEGRGRRVVDTTLSRDIDLAIVVSDNDASNRLFAFVGTEELAERLARVGVTRTRIAQPLGESAPSGERFKPGAPLVAPVIELRPPGAAPITVGSRIGFPIPPPSGPILLGRAHVDAQGRTVPGPLDFAEKNRAPLRELQDLLMMLVRPELSAHEATLAESDRAELLAVLARLPPARARSAKPLHVALPASSPNGAIKVYGKGGRAYGFAVENVYVVDTRTGRSFFLAATVYSNENGTMNDDRYDYDSVANPFITRLGLVLAQKIFGSQD